MPQIFGARAKQANLTQNLMCFNTIKMEPVICFEMIYTDLNPPDLDPSQKVTRIAEQGFQKVEFWGWWDKDIPALRSACQEADVQITNFSGHRKGSLIARETHDLFLDDLKDAVGVAGELDCPTLMLLSNELGEGGRVTEQYDQIASNEKHRYLLEGLKKALDVTPEEISLVLEPLNTKVDHPGYYLADMATSVSLIKEIDDPRLKILADLYHLGVMGEDLGAIIDEHVDLIGYVHIADFPGRHEPGTGSADWKSLLTRLQSGGYTGSVGFEYLPLRDSEESLKRIKELWDQVA